MKYQNNLHTCPVCHNQDQQQLVSHYVRQYSTVSAKQPKRSNKRKDIKTFHAGDFEYRSVIYVSNVNAPTLVQGLKPPNPPIILEKNLRPDFWDRLLAIIVIVLSVSFSNYIGSESLTILIGGVTFCIIIFGRLIHKYQVYKRLLKVYTYENKVYQKRVGVWEKTWVCLNDNVVYNPETGKHITSGIVEELYR